MWNCIAISLFVCFVENILLYILRNHIDGIIGTAAAVHEYTSKQLKLSNYTCTLVMKQVITEVDFGIFQPEYKYNRY